MTRIALVVMWLLHWLPLPVLAALGRLLGRLLYRFGRERRHIALTNLGLCFPGMTAAQKSALARRHFEAFGRSFLERSEERRVGKECRRLCRSRWSPYH
jgi:KDO2-lipid IV(A) lauroyltransferase